jgi:hypothetical protein
LPQQSGGLAKQQHNTSFTNSTAKVMVSQNQQHNASFANSAAKVGPRKISSINASSQIRSKIWIFAATAT